MILAPLLLQLSTSAAPAVEPCGRYVEARTASVFAGACHYGGERTTSGREALLAWSIDTGSFDGVDLSGACVAALVVDDQNLDDAQSLDGAPSARRSVVYVPASASAAQRDALAHWVGTRSAQVLGEVRAVEVVPLSVCVAAESYAAKVPGHFDLAGNSLADHACCKMPFQVWYDPFTTLEGRLVGCDVRFVVEEPVLDSTWSLPGANAAFFGRFGTQSFGTQSSGTLSSGTLSSCPQSSCPQSLGTNVAEHPITSARVAVAIPIR